MYIFLFVCYMAYAYNRKCVALSLSQLIDGGLDASYAGLILSSQSIALAGSQFMFGVLSDRLNPMRLFTAGLIIIGLSAVLFASSTSVVVLCVLWFINGIAQGCGWPALSKILRQKADPKRFGTLWSFLSASNNISGCISPFLSAFLTIKYGWKYSVASAGGCALVFGITLFLFADSSTENVIDLEENRKKDKRQSSFADFRGLLKDPFLLMVFICSMVTFCAKNTLVDWGQVFIQKECGLTFIHGGAFVASIELGGFVGRIVAGFLTDIFVKYAEKYSTPSNPVFYHRVRMSVALGFLISSVLSVHVLRTTLDKNSTLMWTIYLGLLIGALLYGIIAICGIAASESAPSYLSGSAYAITALGGNVGDILSGFPISFLASHFNWSSVFLLHEISIGVMFVILVGFLKFSAKCNVLKKDT